MAKVNVSNSSLKYSLNIEDGKKIGKGVLIALGGAFLTYLAEIVMQIDFGEYTSLVVAVSSVIINLGRKFLVGK